MTSMGSICGSRSERAGTDTGAWSAVLEGRGRRQTALRPGEMSVHDEEKDISREEFIRREPEQDPSSGTAAGPGAPETAEPTQGRDDGPGGAAMEGLGEDDEGEAS